MRSCPEDFQVSENLVPECSGDGEHDYLRIEKTGANTAWVARCLARHAGVPLADVGYAGLKDRHAVTRQWFSVRRQRPVDWDVLQAAGVRILDRAVHRRKLRRGAHRGNAFRIALRGGELGTCRDALVERLETIAQAGVPNYFGPQRFGRAGANLGLARTLFRGRRLSRQQKSLALSAARSFLFNEILDARVRSGTWNRLLDGELANLDGSGSVFPVAGLDEELVRRCAELDIHPTATLWGRAAPRSTGEPGRSEAAVVGRFTKLCAGLEAAGVAAASRALRLAVRDLSWTLGDAVLWLEFSLSRGGFATAVLREIAAVTDSSLDAIGCRT